MKSYTDLEQSKRLAEILPPESADIIIVSIGDREGVVTTTMPKETFNMLRTPFTDVRNTIPCWSLSALLGVLPEYIRFDGHTWKFNLDHNGIYYMNAADTCDTEIFSSSTGVLVDDAFEIILGLKEKSLL